MFGNQVITPDAQAARCLGWTSIGIGLAEVAASRQVEKLLGLDDDPNYRAVVKTMGVRELMHGVSILAQDHRPTQGLATALWSRVAGDVLDTALLGLAATRTRHPARFATTALMVLGIGLADLIFAKRLQDRQ